MDTSSSPASIDQSYQESFIRKIVAAVGLVALLAVPTFLLVVLQRSAHSRMLRPGDSIPVVALRGVDPGVALLSDISGKRAAILFFSVDCPHCQREVPKFDEARKRFAVEFEFIAIARSDSQKTQAFVRSNNVHARVLIDEKGLVGRLFGISEVPALYLVNQDQNIEWVGVGEQPRTELFRRLSVLAARRSLTVSNNVENAQR
jgi:peroxiredoxin